MDAIYDLSRDTRWPVNAPTYSAVFRTRLSATDARDYDAFVARARGSHYSQARSWAPIAAASKPVTPYYFLLRSNGRVIGAALVLRGRLGSLPLPIAQVERGPVCQRKEDLPKVLEALKACTLRRGIARLSVMPYWSEEPQIVASWLEREGFSNNQSFGGRHARSLRINLADIDEAAPFAAPDLAKVRHEVRRAERAGIVVRRGERDDILAFRAMHEDLQRQADKALPQDSWYEALADYFFAGDDRGAVFVCESEGEPISVVFVTCHGGLATYAIGASSNTLLRFPKMVLPMAQAVLWAKKIGAHSFDLGGIPLEGDTDPKRGSIAKFKYGFSHTEVSLVPEHVRWF